MDEYTGFWVNGCGYGLNDESLSFPEIWRFFRGDGLGGGEEMFKTHGWGDGYGGAGGNGSGSSLLSGNGTGSRDLKEFREG